VGLKRHPCPKGPGAVLGSNRTIVGLKLVVNHSLHYPPLSQQSHHCGIETGNIVEQLWTNLGSNRTIVGLKLSTADMAAFSFSAAIAPLWD